MARVYHLLEKLWELKNSMRGLRGRYLCQYHEQQRRPHTHRCFQALSQHDPHHNYHKYYTITTTTVTTTIIVITSAAPYTCLLNILNICFVTGFFCNRGTKRMFCNSDIYETIPAVEC